MNTSEMGERVRHAMNALGDNHVLLYCLRKVIGGIDHLNEGDVDKEWIVGSLNCPERVSSKSNGRRPLFISSGSITGETNE